MTPHDRQRLVRAIVAEVTRRDVTGIAGDDDLVAALGIDSMQGLQILAGVETRLGVRLRDDELVDMRTMDRIVQAASRADIVEKGV